MPYKDPQKRIEVNRIYSRRHYEKNRARVIAKVKEKNQLAHKRNQQLIREFLQGKACVDCGETDPVVLTFDHLRDKKYTISDIIRRAYSTETIMAEIAKCVIRCFNCHMRDEARKRGRLLFKSPIAASGT